MNGPTPKLCPVKSKTMSESDCGVFVHKGRKFRRISQPNLPTDDTCKLMAIHYLYFMSILVAGALPRYPLPPPATTHPIPSRSLILPPPQPLKTKQSRPMSAKGRPKPNATPASMLDPDNGHRLQFSLRVRRM